ncbi:60S ribosomal protein L23a [Fukomys damarensis]|uniref:60S ribosomal protein L23a n=1 Tax=Fukomys damarensis TaxID=885580 RepID=A0A091DWP5_FUKDA|nr:60S ribosomal protein L23a [Fukomys damarensis]
MLFFQPSNDLAHVELLFPVSARVSGLKLSSSEIESATKKTEDNNTLMFTVGVKADKHQIKQAVRKLCDREIATSATKKTEDNNTLMFTVGVKADKHQIKQAVRKLCDREIATRFKLSGSEWALRCPLSVTVVVGLRSQQPWRKAESQSDCQPAHSTRTHCSTGWQGCGVLLCPLAETT